MKQFIVVMLACILLFVNVNALTIDDSVIKTNSTNVTLNITVPITLDNIYVNDTHIILTNYVRNYTMYNQSVVLYNATNTTVAEISLFDQDGYYLINSTVPIVEEPEEPSGGGGGGGGGVDEVISVNQIVYDTLNITNCNFDKSIIRLYVMDDKFDYIEVDHVKLNISGRLYDFMYDNETELYELNTYLRYNQESNITIDIEYKDEQYSFDVNVVGTYCSSIADLDLLGDFKIAINNTKTTIDNLRDWETLEDTQKRLTIINIIKTLVLIVLVLIVLYLLFRLIMIGKYKIKG